MIAAIGISVIDHIMVIDGFKTTEGTFHCEKYVVDGGGMAATAMCTASRLGAKTRLLSRVGDDLNGRYILEGLACFGVDTTGVVKVKGRNSTASFVLVDSTTGEKQFYCELQKPAYIDPIECDLSLLDGAQVLLVDGHWMEAAQKAVRWAQAHDVKVVADFKNMYEGIEKLFPYIDYCIIPFFFAREIANEQNIDRMLRKLTTLQAGIPVVTQGEEGGVYLIDDTIKRYEAFEIDLVDSTGAGDAFHGAFCYFLSRNLDIETCLNLASAVGALNCRSHGGRNSLPTREELAHFLAMKGSRYTLPDATISLT